MVCSHMAPYTGEEVKHSMQSPPWSIHLLQLQERNEPGGAAVGGWAVNAGDQAVDTGGHGCPAPLHQNHCQSVEEGDGFLPFQAQQQGPPRTNCGTVEGDP